MRPCAWRYRDYVIRSLNADKPYTQFLTEQIAGDEMSDDWKKATPRLVPVRAGSVGGGGRVGVADQATIDRIAATGFLRTAPDPTDSYERGLINERMNILADEVEILTSSVMGVTVGCARCHNHKYDPIPQRNYYRLSAILQASYNPYEWKTPNQRQPGLALEAERNEFEAHNAPLDAEIKKIQEQIAKATEPLKAQLLEERLAQVPENVREEVRAAASAKAGARTEAQKALAAKYDSVVNISNNDVFDKNPDVKTTVNNLQKDLNTAREKLLPKPNVRILTDNPEQSVSYLLRRGDPVDYGEVVDVLSKCGAEAVRDRAAF